MSQSGCAMWFACVTVACFGFVALFSGVYSNILIALEGGGSGNGTAGANTTTAGLLVGATASEDTSLSWSLLHWY